MLPCSSGTTGWVSGICGWGFTFTERKQPFASDMMAIVINVKYIAGVYRVECWVKINIAWFMCDKISVILELLRCVAWEVKNSTQVPHVWLGIFTFTQPPIYPYMHVSQKLGTSKILLVWASYTKCSHVWRKPWEITNFETCMHMVHMGWWWICFVFSNHQTSKSKVYVGEGWFLH